MWLTIRVQERFLMRIVGEGLADEEGRAQEAGRVVYVLHPNCPVEDFA